MHANREHAAVYPTKWKGRKRISYIKRGLEFSLNLAGWGQKLELAARLPYPLLPAPMYCYTSSSLRYILSFTAGSIIPNFTCKQNRNVSQPRVYLQGDQKQPPSPLCVMFKMFNRAANNLG